MIGDIATAVGGVKFDIFLLEDAVRRQQMLTFPVAAHSDDVRVFANEQHVFDSAGLARCNQALLQRERFSIANEAKIDDEAGVVVRDHFICAGGCVYGEGRFFAVTYHSSPRTKLDLARRP